MSRTKQKEKKLKSLVSLQRLIKSKAFAL